MFIKDADPDVVSAETEGCAESFGPGLWIVTAISLGTAFFGCIAIVASEIMKSGT